MEGKYSDGCCVCVLGLLLLVVVVVGVLLVKRAEARKPVGRGQS